jgi:FixJ family two-component response regulator
VGQADPTISVIDDDESVRRALRRLIRSAGFDVETFRSAEDFLASGEGYAPACLILDVRMPGMSGLELQRRLATSGRHIPIVFITAHEDEPARRATLDAGAVGFLQKPFDDLALLEAVAKALKGDRGVQP